MPVDLEWHRLAEEESESEASRRDVGVALARFEVRCPDREASIGIRRAPVVDLLDRFAEDGDVRLFGADQLKVVDQRRVARRHVVARRAGLVPVTDWASRTRSSSAQPNAVIVADMTSSTENWIIDLAGCDVRDRHRPAVRRDPESRRPRRSCCGPVRKLSIENHEPEVAVAPGIAHSWYSPGKTPCTSRRRSRRTPPGTRGWARPRSTEPQAGDPSTLVAPCGDRRRCRGRRGSGTGRLGDLRDAVRGCRCGDPVADQCNQRRGSGGSDPPWPAVVMDRGVVRTLAERIDPVVDDVDDLDRTESARRLGPHWGRPIREHSAVGPDDLRGVRRRLAERVRRERVVEASGRCRRTAPTRGPSRRARSAVARWRRSARGSAAST